MKTVILNHTAIKYVLIALKADNHGEGGIFALYALVRHQKKWLIVPALIGGAALLADGTLTPAAGIIGSGKSSLTQILAQELGSEPFFEPVEDNPVLPLKDQLRSVHIYAHVFGCA